MLIDHFYTWMGFICGAIYFTGFELLIIAILLFNGHDGLECPLGIDEGDLGALLEVGRLLRAGSESNWNRPR